MGSCQVCSSAATSPHFVKLGFEFVRCSGCGHISVNNVVQPETLAQHYGTTFFEGGDYSDYLGDRAILQRNFRRFATKLARFAPGGRLFEIGCAYGFFLDVARDRWDVSGIDIAEDAVVYARNQLKLRVTCGNLLQVELPSQSAEAVVMWDTIEHLERPSDYVAKAAAMLTPGGVLALTTGDAGSLLARARGKQWRLYHPPSHLHYFSRDTIGRLLRRNGLELVHFEHVGYSRSLDTMLFRLFGNGSSPSSARLYDLARATGLASVSLYLNLFDIMFVVGRKP
jgi:SAM-dependent methyltransferase